MVELARGDEAAIGSRLLRLLRLRDARLRIRRGHGRDANEVIRVIGSG